jgi:hypothetical protein
MNVIRSPLSRLKTRSGKVQITGVSDTLPTDRNHAPQLPGKTTTRRACRGRPRQCLEHGQVAVKVARVAWTRTTSLRTPVWQRGRAGAGWSSRAAVASSAGRALRARRAHRKGSTLRDRAASRGGQCRRAASPRPPWPPGSASFQRKERAVPALHQARSDGPACSQWCEPWNIRSGGIDRSSSPGDACHAVGAAMSRHGRAGLRCAGWGGR